MDSAVFYPLVIGVFALWFVFATRGGNSEGSGLKSIFFGGVIVVVTFGVLLIEGLSAADAFGVLIFERGDPWGMRRFAAVGYLLMIAGVILMLRSRLHGRPVSGNPEQ